MDAGGHVLLTLVFLLNFTYEHLDLLLKKLVALKLVVFVGWLKLDLNEVGICLEKVNKALLALLVPFKVLMLLELEFLKTFVYLKGLTHKLQALGRDISKVNLFDI